VTAHPAISVWVALAAINAAYNVYSTVRGLAALVRLPEPPPERAVWPKLSLIVAACNEADTLETATRSKLQSDYPNLEVVLVDDRSTDGTSELADRLAASDPRVTVVHVSELPSGWLGKLHAMHVGVRHATGDWLLFSDADVMMDTAVLRQVMHAALARDLEFAALVPQVLPSSFLFDAIMASFMRLLVVGGRLWKVSDPSSRAAVGAGAFNLVKRAALDRTQGFEWLKLEIADDVALAQMLKRAGARSAVIDGASGVRLHFYRSVGEMMRGLEKNGYAVFGALRPLRLLVTLVVVAGLELGPFLGLFLASTPLVVTSALTLLALALSQVLVARRSRRGLSSAMVHGPGVLALLLFAVRSAIVTHARGGVVWRGTLYPLAELRSGRRLTLF
jgi:glycosyltransferase involved in cell wall biosynthesis